MHVKYTMLHTIYTLETCTHASKHTCTIYQSCLNLDHTENGVFGPLRVTPSVLTFRKAIVSLPFS